MSWISPISKILILNREEMTTRCHRHLIFDTNTLLYTIWAAESRFLRQTSHVRRCRCSVDICIFPVNGYQKWSGVSFAVLDVRPSNGSQKLLLGLTSILHPRLRHASPPSLTTGCDCQSRQRVRVGEWWPGSSAANTPVACSLFRNLYGARAVLRRFRPPLANRLHL